MSRIRVAAVQYFIRPVDRFEAFRAQIESLVDTARDYDCQLVVLPEYCTLQLLTLGDVRRPVAEQVRDLARQAPRYVETMSEVARKNRVYVLSGSIPVAMPNGEIQNHAFLFNPDGAHGVQAKLHMTRFEAEDWKMSAGSQFRVFDTALGRVAIAICYDVEFPEIARAAALAGVHLLLVPSCTDDRQGFLRVRYCAHARAIENQIYVVVSHTVGSLPMVPAVSLNYGQAAILTPSDFSFARDGVIAEGDINQETMVIGEMNMDTISDSRTSGTVLPLVDSRRTASLVSQIEEVSL